MNIENAAVKKVGHDYDREVIECALNLIDAQKRFEKEKAKSDFWAGFTSASFAYSVAREAGLNNRNI